jgi:hypothetical protein
MSAIFLKKICSGRHSDQKFGWRRWGVKFYRCQGKKRLRNTVPACSILRKNFRNGVPERLSTKMLMLIIITERGGLLDDTPASCSGGLGFKSRPEDRLFWLSVFVVFFSPSRQMPGLFLKLDHDRFLPHNFQFIIHVSSVHSTLYSLKASLNKL